MIIKRKLFSEFRNNVPKKIKLSKELSLVLLDKNFISKLLGVVNKVKKRQNRFVDYAILYNYKPIGSIELIEISPKEILIEWIGIDRVFTNEGFAQLVISGIIDNVENLGYDIISSEIPGDAIKLAYILFKLGFDSELIQVGGLWKHGLYKFTKYLK